MVKAIVGFEADSDGMLDVNMPILENMDKAIGRGIPLLAKGYNYEIPELGITKDNYIPTIYNNLLYIGV